MVAHSVQESPRSEDVGFSIGAEMAWLFMVLAQRK